jgi:hypothetical protein
LVAGLPEYEPAEGITLLNAHLVAETRNAGRGRFGFGDVVQRLVQPHTVFFTVNVATKLAVAK